MIGGRYPHLRETRSGFVVGRSTAASLARVLGAVVVLVAIVAAADALGLIS